MFGVKFFSLFNLFAAFADALPDVEAADALPPEPEAPEDWLAPGTLVLFDDRRLAFIEKRSATDSGVFYTLREWGRAKDGWLYRSNEIVTRPAWAVEDWWTLDMVGTTTAATEVTAVAEQ